MPGYKIEKFVRSTADYTLRECYKRLGNLQMAEEAFIEVYVAWYKTRFSNLVICRRLILDYAIVRICKSMQYE